MKKRLKRSKRSKKSKKQKKQKKSDWALVLSGGAASGMAHIGVIKVLERNKIIPNIIIGTSAGALIGGMYAAGLLSNFERIISNKTKKQIRKIIHIWPSKEGLIKTDRLEKQFRNIIGNKKIENLDKKFVAISADLLTGKRIVIDKGDLCEAIMASISIPFLFPPLHKKGMLLVDGGFEDPLAIDEGFNLAKKILAVNVERSIESMPKKLKYNLVDFFERIQTILRLEIVNFTLSKYKKNLFILNPKAYLGVFDFDKSKEAIAIGERITEKNLYKIKKLLIK